MQTVRAYSPKVSVLKQKVKQDLRCVPTLPFLSLRRNILKCYTIAYEPNRMNGNGSNKQSKDEKEMNKKK